MSGPYGDATAQDVAAVATPERVAGTVRDVAGDPVDIGPLRVGPGGVATATAHGRVRDCAVRREDVDGLVSYLAEVDLRLDLDVVAAGRHHGFDAELVVRLRITVVGASAGQVTTSVAPPVPEDVDAVLRPRGLQSRVLMKVGNVPPIVREEAVAYIADRLTHADVRAAMVLTTAGLDRGAGG